MANIQLDYCDIATREMVYVTISDDGAVMQTRAPRTPVPGTLRMSGHDNHYLGFSGANLPGEAPTEAQRAILARVWLGDRSRIGACPNAQVCDWAFGGFEPNEINQRYGDGRRIFRA